MLDAMTDMETELHIDIATGADSCCAHSLPDSTECTLRCVLRALFHVLPAALRSIAMPFSMHVLDVLNSSSFTQSHLIAVYRIAISEFGCFTLRQISPRATSD